MAYTAEDYKKILGVSAACANEMAAGRMKPTDDQLEKLEGSGEVAAEPDSQMTLSLGDDDE